MKEEIKKIIEEAIKDFEVKPEGFSIEIPDETQVLVGYCRGKKHWNWIFGDPKNMRYNIRYGNGYDVNGKMAVARFLVLYLDKDFLHREIYTIKPNTARIYTQDEMKKSGYVNPSHSLYFVFELAEKNIGSMINGKWEEFTLVNKDDDRLSQFIGMITPDIRSAIIKVFENIDNDKTDKYKFLKMISSG